jgi:beta-lactamase class A
MNRPAFLTTALAALAPPSGDAAIAALERAYGGRLGVFALDTGSGRTIAHRANERFPMCSTFKLLAVGAVLSRVQHGNEDLNRQVAFSRNDLLPYAPIVRKRLGHGYTAQMSVADLCAAAIEWNDNTAANLLLHSLLGPAGVTRYARSLGDRITRLDRDEPDVNTAIPGDPRDTTTPAAIAGDMRALALGTALPPRLRARLQTWLAGCKTGELGLRTGFPSTWRIGEKTGSGAHATADDVAVAWPPGRAPIVVAAYYTGSRANDRELDATLASVGRIVTRTLSPSLAPIPRGAR